MNKAEVFNIFNMAASIFTKTPLEIQMEIDDLEKLITDPNWPLSNDQEAVDKTKELIVMLEKIKSFKEND